MYTGYDRRTFQKLDFRPNDGLPNKVDFYEKIKKI